MYYVIMSQNSLEGFLRGHFKVLGNLFLQEYSKIEDGSTGITWTSIIFDAFRFTTEAEAWEMVFNIWKDWGKGNFLVMSIHEEAMEKSKEAKSDILREEARRIETSWQKYAIKDKSN